MNKSLKKVLFFWSHLLLHMPTLHHTVVLPHHNKTLWFLQRCLSSMITDQRISQVWSSWEHKTIRCITVKFGLEKKSCVKSVQDSFICFCTVGIMIKTWWVLNWSQGWWKQQTGGPRFVTFMKKLSWMHEYNNKQYVASFFSSVSVFLVIHAMDLTRGPHISYSASQHWFHIFSNDQQFPHAWSMLKEEKYMMSSFAPVFIRISQAWTLRYVMWSSIVLRSLDHFVENRCSFVVYNPPISDIFHASQFLWSQ